MTSPRQTPSDTIKFNYLRWRWEYPDGTEYILQAGDTVEWKHSPTPTVPVRYVQG